MNRTLCHYTITTGHARQSPRSEVGDDVIAALTPLLRTGAHELPAPPGGYRLRVTIERDVLAATVSTPEGAPLVTVFVAATPDGLGAALEVLRHAPTAELSAPCALVQIHETIALDPDATSWLGDFERCIAWAWVELREGAS